MRLLHTSDLHLGMSLFGASLIDHQREMLRSLVKLANDNSCDGVIISGDIFDRAVPSPDAVRLWSDFCAELCGDRDIPAYVIAGNHDGGVRLATCSRLLERGGLHILSSGLETHRIGDVALHLLPYFTVDDVRAEYPDAELKNFADAASLMVAEASKRVVEGCYNILCCHMFVNGATVSDSERSLVSGGLSSVASDAFSSFDYIAAGHLHRRQTLGAVRYSGSPLCYSFGEASHRKCALLIDTESGEVTDVDIPQPYRLVTLRGSMDEIADSGRCDDFVCCEVTEGYDGYSSREVLRELFPNLLRITVVGRDRTVEGEVGSLTGSIPGPEELIARYAADTGLEVDEELVKWFCDTATAVAERENSEEVSEK